MEQQSLKPNYQDQIAALQTQIANLRSRAVMEIKVKLAEARNQVAEYERQIAQFTPGSSIDNKPKMRRPRAKIAMKQIAEAIQGGATNYTSLSKALNCSLGFLRKKIEADGKTAGISSIGSGKKFRLRVK